MAVPVVQSSSNSAFANSGSTVITKPSGLVEGDMLVVFLEYIMGNSRAFATPAGWSLRTKVEDVLTGSGYSGVACFTKVAEAADVAASDFTFGLTDTSTGTLFAGVLYRVNTFLSPPSIVVESDSAAASSATVNFVAALTPPSVESLVFMMLGCDDRSLSAEVSASAQTSTPSLTWTELVEVKYKSGASGGSIIVATAPTSLGSEITAYGATLSESVTTHLGILLIIPGTHNESIAVAAVHGTSTVNTPVPTVSVTRTATLVEGTSTVNTPTATTGGDKWVATVKSATATVVNTPKS